MFITPHHARCDAYCITWKSHVWYFLICQPVALCQCGFTCAKACSQTYFREACTNISSQPQVQISVF